MLAGLWVTLTCIIIASFLYGAHNGTIMTICKLAVFLLTADYLIGALILPAQFMGQSENNMNKWSLDFVGHTISFATFETLASSESDLNSFTLLFLCPNGVQYEELSDFLVAYGTALGVKRVATFNYRGVGRSRGRFLRSAELVDDTLDVIKYMESKYQVSPSELLLHGWSLGGAVGLKVKEIFPQVRVIHDRSFASLDDVALWMFGSRLPAAIIGLIVAGLLYFLGGINRNLFLPASMFFSCIVSTIIPLVLWALKYNIDVDLQVLSQESPLLIVYHENDGIINYDSASLHRLVNSSHQNVHSFQLQTYFQNHAANHMYLLNRNASEWNAYLKIVRSMLKNN